MFMFIFGDSADVPSNADIIIEDLLKKFKRSSRFAEVRGRPVLLDEISAKIYLTSDPLDLDHLSFGDTGP
jgi:hypothetical protein